MSETTVTVARLPSSFTKKKIDVTFTVATGALGPSATDDTVTLSGHRCTVEVVNAGMRYACALTLRIEGMTLAMMNRLSVACPPVAANAPDILQGSRNVVTVAAGDDERGMSTIFSGQIFEAFIDFQGAPEVAFQVVAQSALQANIAAIESVSYRGPVKVQSILSDIAARAGLDFINHGVNLTHPGNWICRGTAGDQIEKICGAFKLPYTIDGVGAQTSPRLTVWPRGGSSIDTASVPRVTKNSGLIGYPAYSQSGVQFASLFNPNITYWSPVYLEATYLPAGWVKAAQTQTPQLASTGYWIPFSVTHALESEIPGGRWFTYVEAVSAAFAQQIKAS